VLLGQQADFLFPGKQCDEGAHEAAPDVPGETCFVMALFVVKMIFSWNEKYRRR